MAYDYSTPEEYHSELTGILSDYAPSGRQVDELYELLKGKDVFFVAAGRSRSVAEFFAELLLEGGTDAKVLSVGYPPKYGKDSVVFGISGSGGTGSVVYQLEQAKKAGANIGLMTSNPGSKAAMLATGPNDITIEIPAKDKNQIDLSNPFIEGSEFEIKALMLSAAAGFGMDSGIGFDDCYEPLVSGIRKYCPTNDEINNVCSIMPATQTERKTMMISESGLNYVIGNMEAIRHRHLFKEGERRIESYEGTIPTKKGDLIKAITTYGFVSGLISKEKTGGAKVLVLTGSENSLAAKLNPDCLIVIPGIPEDSILSDGSVVKRDLFGEILFNLNAAVLSETIAYEAMHRVPMAEPEAAKNHSKIS